MVSLVTYLIGLHDPYGVDHSERVADLCLMLGERMKLEPAIMENLELAALLHDVGKMALPDSVRQKPGALTEAEMILMQQHPFMGLNILKRMNGNISRDVHLAIYHHHENWDGSGYPSGLKGVAIPLKARIIRIADSYDALTHMRGYKPAEPATSALQKMIADQQQQLLYDPNLFQVFIKLMME